MSKIGPKEAQRRALRESVRVTIGPLTAVKIKPVPAENITGKPAAEPTIEPIAPPSAAEADAASKFFSQQRRAGRPPMKISEEERDLSLTSAKPSRRRPSELR